MAFHALIGAGFLAATFLVRPFLPSSEMDTEDICGGGGGAAQDNITSMSAAADVVNTTAAATAEEGIQSIAWPFIISGVWCILFSFGFLLLAALPFKVEPWPHQTTSDLTSPTCRCPASTSLPPRRLWTRARHRRSSRVTRT